jgi:hypothetical protein
MDPRREKAHQIADRARITFTDGCYRVPSQSGNGTYTVILDEQDSACDCPDFELRSKDCKHILAVKLFTRRQERGVGQDLDDVRPSKKVKWPTYKQSWPEYNAAQTNEGRHFGHLLADLCGSVEEPVRTGRGRPPVPLADQVYAATTKVYSLFSARRFMSQLEESHERGLLSKPMHFNSVLNALENPVLTPILRGLIERSSLPMRAIETTFAPDSSGFCTSRFIPWFDIKYGITRETAEWVKLHAMVGVKTNIVTAVEILDKDAADCPQFKPLLEPTAKSFTVKEVDADKAYCSGDNHDAVNALGGKLFAAFKSNATGGVGGIFEKMFFHFMFNREGFLAHYHQRSNVESTFSAIKRKFGDSVRSKTDTAMTNEVLCKILCHNICCCIASWYELGIEPDFFGADSCTEKDDCAQIIKFPGA